MLFSNLLSYLFFADTLLPLTLAGGIGALLILLIQPFLARRFSPRWRYWSWAPVLLLFLIPLRIPLPQPESLPAFESLSPVAAVNDALSFPVLPLPSSGQSGGYLLIPLYSVLGIIWLGGVLICICREIWRGLRFLGYLKKRCTPVQDPQMLEVLACCRTQLKIRRTIPLYTSPLIDSPILIGLLHPRILLPDTEIPQQNLRFILLHELSHYRNGDLFYKLFALVIRTLHWFNPLAWLVFRRIQALCEFSCDAAATKGMDFSERKAYGMAILELMGQTKKYPAFSSAFSLSKKDLKKRLSMLLEQKHPSKRLVLLAALSITLLTLIGCSFASYFFSPGEAASIGIIGGADGPTAVFITGPDAPESDPAVLMDNLAWSVSCQPEQQAILYIAPLSADESWYWTTSGQKVLSDGTAADWPEASIQPEPGALTSLPASWEGIQRYTLTFTLWDGQGAVLAQRELTWENLSGQARSDRASQLLGQFAISRLEDGSIQLHIPNAILLHAHWEISDFLNGEKIDAMASVPPGASLAYEEADQFDIRLMDENGQTLASSMLELDEIPEIRFSDTGDPYLFFRF